MPHEISLILAARRFILNAILTQHTGTVAFLIIILCTWNLGV